MNFYCFYFELGHRFNFSL